MSAEKRANCDRAAAVSGVVLLPKFMTVTTMRMPRKSPAALLACNGELVRGNGGLAGLPDRRDPDRVEAGGLGQLHLRHRHCGIGVPALVLGCTHVHPVARERLGRQ